MPLDVARLQVLVEVAHAGSIAAAAHRLSFTASALSQQLAKLERELGCRLLERGPGGMRLTPVGAVLLEHGERVLGELREAEPAVRAAMHAEPERLAVGAFATAAKTLLPRALAELRARRPGARLSLVDLEPPDGYGLVTARELDLLITHRYPGVRLPGAGGLRRHRLLAYPLRLVLPWAHPLARHARAGIGLAELAGEEWIAGGHGVPNRTSLDTLSAEADTETHVAYETADYEVTLALVAAGLGIALVPASVLAATERDRIAVRMLRGPQPAREIHLVHRARPTGLTGELITILHEFAA